MSRMTGSNIVKMIAAFLFVSLAAFYVLLIGLGAKKKNLIFEGLAYALAFVVSFSLVGSGIEGVGSLILLGSMGAGVVRSFQLRDLWLPRKPAVPQQIQWIQNPPPPVQWAQGPPPPVQWAQGQPPSVQWAQGQPPSAQWAQNRPPHRPPMNATPPQPEPVRPSEDLSTALSWASSTAKQNKYRLPPEAYVTILEIYQTLDATIDENRRQPSNDAGFEYELESLVKEYLPAVLNAYLAIPSSMVNNRQPNGRTANEELHEQLGLLYGQADALHSSRHNSTSAELSSTGNFLRERFGHHKPGGFDFGIE